MSNHRDPAEIDRIERLRQFGVLDTPEDRSFRALAEQALILMPGTSIAAVSLIDTERQWFKTIVGLDVTETPRAFSFCAHTIQSDGVMVVSDALADDRFVDNPLVTGAPRIRFYAGIKLIGGVGALCAMGLQPRRATGAEITKLKTLASLVDIQLLSHGTLFNLSARRISESFDHCADVVS